MRTKGFSLVELLSVTLLIALVAVIISVAYVSEIDRARGSRLASEARIAYIAANAVITELKAAGTDVTDDEYMRGLTGTADSDYHIEARLSERMNTWLGADITLGTEPAEGVAALTFVVENGELVSMTYRSALDGRYYAVTIAGGETTVTRENPQGE